MSGIFQKNLHETAFFVRIEYSLENPEDKQSGMQFIRCCLLNARSPFD